LKDMSEQALLDFCEERDVEVYTHYDQIVNKIFLKMRKPGKNLQIEECIGSEVANTKAFGLTIRVILRRMADELDKMLEKEAVSS